MRNLPVTFKTAVLDKTSLTMYIKAIIQPSKISFIKPRYNHPFGPERYLTGVPTNEPIGQCVIYHPDLEMLYTFIVDNETGELICMKMNSNTEYSISGSGFASIYCNLATKPSAIISNTENAVDLYYWDKSYEVAERGLKKICIDLTTMSVVGSVESIDLSFIDTIEYGSPIAINYNILVLCYYTSSGGVGVAIGERSSPGGSFFVWSIWPERFMSQYTLTRAHATIYTAAAYFNDAIYVYYTDMESGEVKGIEFNPYNNSWSDISIVLPADLTRFDISNAIVANDNVHLSGQFYRTEDYINGRVYSLVLRSNDGLNFSWDKFTLLSRMGLRFHIALDIASGQLYAGDRNVIGVSSASYTFMLNPPNELEINHDDIIGFNASSTTATIGLAAANEEYYENDIVAKDNRVLVYLGYPGSGDNSAEYVLYGTYIIDAISEEYADGRRNLALQLIPEGLWRMARITFPFYSEILAKSSSYDDCDQLDGMYVVPTGTRDYLSYLTVDFWNNEEWDGDDIIDGTPTDLCGGPQSEPTTVSNKNGDALLIKTQDLTASASLMSLPTINGVMNVSLYGWEYTTSGRTTEIWDLYAVTAPSDDLANKTVTAGIKMSTYKRFPKELYAPSPLGGAANGSYPIQYSFSLTEGHKLLYFGLRMVNNSTQGSSVINLERLEITSGISFRHTAFSTASAWTLEDPDDLNEEFIVAPSNCLQNIMFTNKPYSAFNFTIGAEFGYKAGTVPLTSGTTAWGVIGLAEDGYNFICARYKRQNSKIELCLFRDGICTVLQQVSSDTTHGIMLEHRSGTFRIYKLNDSTENWEGPVLTHVYDETVYGPLSTSETGVMHTGVYAATLAPGFITAGFSQPHGGQIGMNSETDWSVLTAFPTSGKVIIDDTVYKYTNKTTNLTSVDMKYGPYQPRQFADYGDYMDGGVWYKGDALEISLFKPQNERLNTKDLIIAQSNGNNWLLTKSDWDVVHQTGGEPDYLRNRSRHYFDDDINDDYYTADMSDRVYINHGLLGVTLHSGEAVTHQHGARVSLYCTDKIWVKKVTTSTLERNATVKDLISRLCANASVNAEFPGDLEDENVSLTTKETRILQGSTLLPGGVDIRLVTPVLNAGEYIKLRFPNLMVSDEDATIAPEIYFGVNSDKKLLCGYKLTDTEKKYIVQTNYNGYRSMQHNLRVLWHEEFISIFLDNRVFATFGLEEDAVIWPDQQLAINMYASGSKTISSINVSELFDWREAIYVESEKTVSSALESVVQERPIDLLATDTGGLSFSYNLERDSISYSTEESDRIILSHKRSFRNSDSAGSDAIVYYSDVDYVSNDRYADSDGFTTRVIKLSSLDTGAKIAAHQILKKAHELQTSHTLLMRPDLRIQVGDILKVQYQLSGTQTIKQFHCIVNDINIDLGAAQFKMQVTARNKELEETTNVPCYLKGIAHNCRSSQSAFLRSNVYTGDIRGFVSGAKNENKIQQINYHYGNILMDDEEYTLATGTDRYLLILTGEYDEEDANYYAGLQFNSTNFTKICDTGPGKTRNQAWGLAIPDEWSGSYPLAGTAADSGASPRLQMILFAGVDHVNPIFDFAKITTHTSHSDKVSLKIDSRSDNAAIYDILMLHEESETTTPSANQTELYNRYDNRRYLSYYTTPPAGENELTMSWSFDESPFSYIIVSLRPDID